MNDAATCAVRSRREFIVEASAITVAFHRSDPALPPVSPERVTRLHFTARETALRVR
jgi:hypothetical protein